MLDVFVGEALAAGTLGEADAFSEGAVIGFAVGRVELMDWVAAFDTDGHIWRPWLSLVASHALELETLHPHLLVGPCNGCCFHDAMPPHTANGSLKTYLQMTRVQTP